MARINLTPSRIGAFKCRSGGQAFLWDSTVPGLGVRATGKGRKTYIYQSRFRGKAFRVTLKEVGGVTLEDARTLATEISALVSKGIDPREHKRKIETENKAAKKKREKEKARQDLLESKISEVWAEYLKKRRPDWGERHYLDHVRLSQAGGEKVKRGKGTKKQGPLFPLMKTRLSDLDSDILESWLKKEKANRPGQTRLAFGLFKAFLTWCAYHKIYKESLPNDIISPTVRSTVPKKKAKVDSLQREQLPGWFAAVQQIQNPVISSYLQVLLLVGARREELAQLQWKDCDFRWNSINIKDKVEGVRIIPMTPYVKHLIQWQPKRNKWVFSSPRSKSGYIQEPRIQHKKALKIAAINDLTLHGLRRSFSNLSEWVEVPVGVIAQIMGHKPSATAEKHYKDRPLDLLRMWHIKIEKWILDQAGIDLPSDEDGRQQIKLVANK